MERFVEEIMQRDVLTVGPDTSVRDLLRRLVDAQISGLPVVSADKEILGVVSTTDVIRLGAEAADAPPGRLTWEPLALPGEEYDEDSAAPFFLVSEDWTYPTEGQAQAVSEGIFDGYSVADIMTPAAFTVGPRDSVGEVAKFLLQGRIHRALVVEDGQLMGIVTAFDLLRALVGD